MRRFLDMSIKYKLLIMLTVSSIVPILFLGVFAYQSGTKAIKMETSYAIESSLKQIGENLSFNLYQIESYSTMVTQSQSVQENLKASVPMTDESREAIVNEMSNAQKYSSTPFKSLIITSDEEVVYHFEWPGDAVREATSMIVSEGALDRAKYDDSLHYWKCRESYISGFEAQRHYYFYRSILDENKDFLGTLFIDVNAYTFDRMLSLGTDSDEGLLLLADEEGRVIFPSYHYGEAIEEIEDGFVQNEMNVSIQAFPWEIYYLQESGNAGQSMGQLIPVIIILLIVVLAVECMLFRFFNYSISRPLIELRNTVEELPQNGFQIRQHNYAKDEIGVLAEGIEEMAVKMRQLIRTVKDEEREMEKLEFLMLQAQIKPHFLYNSLNSIMLIADFMGCGNIKHAIECLVKILQYSIDNFDNEITVMEEVDYLESYVLLNNIRFKNKIKFICDIPDELKQQKIVKFLFQPLVENAIVHGLRDKVGIGTIRLAIRRAEDNLVCTVEDNGVGISPQRLKDVWKAQETTQYDRLHIGIKNIKKRIKLVYGEEYGMHIESRQDEGTRVTLMISSNGRRFDEGSDRR